MVKELKILIVDDHKILRQGFRLILESQNELNLKIVELVDGEEVNELHAKENFDVIFMDINMKNIGGIEATRKLTKRFKSAKVIALSMHNDEFNIKRMIDAGALGYLLKDTGVDELIKAIRTVYSGQKYFSNEVALKLLGMQSDDSKNSNITKRELEILMLISEGLTNDEIASELHISKRTVDSHRQNLLSKSSCKNTAELITYSLKNKLISI